MVDIQTKNIFKLAHKIILFETENKTFYTTNKLFNKWKKNKKTCVRIEQSFNISEASVLQSLKNEICIEETNMSKNDNCTKEVISHVQHCSKCNQPRHNAQTYELKSVISKEKNDI